MKALFALQILLFSASTFAAAFVDPRLVELANRKPYDSTRVIMVLKTEPFVPVTARHRNDIKDQHKEIYRQLSSRVPMREPVSIWAAHVLIATVNNDKLRLLSEQTQIAALYYNSRKFITPTRQITVVDPTKAKHDQYTFGLTLMEIDKLRKAAPKINGTGQVVGVIDTGIDGQHAQLKDRIAGWFDFVNKRPEPYDDSFHGTHVSGTIVGDGTSIDLRFGVAPQAKIMAFKVFHADGSATDEECLIAMQFAMDPDGNPKTDDFPPIINNSWGGNPTTGQQSSNDNPYCRLVQSWLRTGIVGVFSAGNSGPKDSTVNEPAACPGALAVAAIDRDENAADWSSRGPALWKEGALFKPEVAAPGVRVFSTLPGNKYGLLNGTSMAAPHVSGALALLRQAEPRLSPVQAIKCMIRTAKDLGPYRPDKTYGNGLVKAYEMIWAARSGMCK